MTLFTLQRLAIGGVTLAALVTSMVLAPAPVQAQDRTQIALMSDERPPLTDEQRQRALTAVESAKAACRNSAGDDDVAYSICVAQSRGKAFREEAEKNKTTARNEQPND